MLLSLLRNNQGSGAECPHSFGQGYTVGVGLGTFGQAGRGKSRYGGFRRSRCDEVGLGLVRYVRLWRGGHVQAGSGTSRYVAVRSVAVSRGGRGTVRFGRVG